MNAIAEAVSWRAQVRSWRLAAPAEPEPASVEPPEPTEHILTMTRDCLDVEQLLHIHHGACYSVDLDPHTDAIALDALIDHLGINDPGTYMLTHTPPDVWRIIPTPPAPAPPPPVTVTEPVRRCEMTDIEEIFCSHCWGHTSPIDQVRAESQARRIKRQTPIPAARPGTCAGCRHPYGPNTPVRRDPAGGYRLACCWDVL